MKSTAGIKKSRKIFEKTALPSPFLPASGGFERYLFTSVRHNDSFSKDKICDKLSLLKFPLCCKTVGMGIAIFPGVNATN